MPASDIASNEVMKTQNSGKKLDKVPSLPEETVNTTSSNGDPTESPPPNSTTYGDVVREMDEAYNCVNDEHSSELLARKTFARYAAFATFLVNMCFLLCGAGFFASQTDWEAVDVALFTVYTVTSAGYGHVEIPDTPLFQIVDTIYILVGLSLMATMMAQGYQFLELEASQFQNHGDKAEVLEQGIKRLEQEPQSEKRDKALEKLKAKKKKAG